MLDERNLGICLNVADAVSGLQVSGTGLRQTVTWMDLCQHALFCEF